MKQSRTTKRILMRVAAAMVIGGAAMTVNLQAEDNAAGACTNATFKGLYGLSVEGVLLMPDAPGPIPFNVAGLMQADGMGTLTVFRQMTNVGGSVFPIDFAAAAQPAVEYSVNPDCTATIEFFLPGDSGIPIVPPDGLPFAAAMVLVNSGREAIGIQTTPQRGVFGEVDAD